MLREVPGRNRPIERCALRQGYRVETGSDDLIEARWYPVAGHVLILVPGWARGRACREGMIARQIWLHALATAGEEWIDGHFEELRRRVRRGGFLDAAI